MEEKKIQTSKKKPVTALKAKVETIKAEKAKQKKIKQEKPKPEKAKAPRPNRTKLLVSIVNRSDGTQLKTILDECSVALSLSFEGTGTARSAILDYFGIGETEKTIVLSLFPESDEDLIIREIRTKMSLYLVGRGISFTVPLTGVSEIVANGLSKASAKKTVLESMIMTEERRTYDLIVCAVNAEHSDEAMEAARSAGAAGGTIMHARMLDNKKAEQFIGISLAREQEILLILTKREGKLAIMQALFDRVGVKTEAGGIIFSVPVDRTVGIGADETSEVAATKDKEVKEETPETSAEAQAVNEAEVESETQNEQ
ncbi:MAG: hypothetical protein K2L02_02480 [Clostridia bacterium]|nr:hypothetical protein [Clostridia bacterium]